MKRMFLCVAALAVLLTACGGQTDSASVSDDEGVTASSAAEAAEDNSEKEAEEALKESISSQLPYDAEVMITGLPGSRGITVICDDMDFTDFGNKIYYAVQAYEAADTEGYDLDVVMMDDDEIVMMFNNSIGDYGFLSDKRSGESKGTPLQSVEDLAAEFPALYETLGLSTMPAEDQELYHRIMDALDSNPQRSEDEIYSDLALQEGISSDELKWFSLYMFDVLYSHSDEIFYQDEKENYLNNVSMDVDQKIYSTPMPDLAGTIMRESGVVKEKMCSGDFSVVVLETDSGKVYLCQNNASIEAVGNEHSSCVPSWLNWHALQVGEAATVYFYYGGTSTDDGSPIGLFVYKTPDK